MQGLGSQKGAAASPVGMGGGQGNGGSYTPTYMSGFAPPVAPQRGAPYQPIFGPRNGF